MRTPQHAISASEALGMYATGSAFCAFQQRNVGRLQPGMLADVLVLEPGSLGDAGDIPDGPLTTIAGGEVVHDQL